MAKKRKSDAYRKLVSVMIVLFVLALLCGAGYVLLDQSIKAQETENAARAQQENAQLEEQYQQAKAEEAAQEARVEPAQWPQPKQEGWDVIDVSEFALTNAATENVSRQELLMGGMVLVNRWHNILPLNMPIDQLAGVHATDRTIPTRNSSVKLYPAAITALGQMLAGAKADGLESYNVEEGYRTVETQQSYYDKVAQKYSGRYTGDNLVAKVISEGVSYPGTSEYESGFAFQMERYSATDTELMNKKFYELPQSDWLVAHSWEYGIVFRFPVRGYPNSTVTDKSFKTGQNLRLSIYRYVGQPHAAAMHAMDFCMEEYIEYLMAHPHIAVYENGTLRYEILRIPADNYADQVAISYTRTSREHTASFDNVGGVIVAMTY